MGSAKEIRVEPISARDARRLVRALHYSGKVDPRSLLHLGVFLRGRLRGAMQFGPSIDKRRTIGLVDGTAWNGWLELNRMAFSEDLPRNSESRAIAVAARLIRKHYPHVEWILSYADATQCGDGAIYRASGFLLTQIRPNSTMYRLPSGEVVAKIVLEPGFGSSGPDSIKTRLGKSGSETASAFLRRVGAERIPGFQLRYILPLAPGVRERLSCPVLPFSAIDDAGAGMYLGESKRESQDGKPGIQSGNGGSSPTLALHPDEGE